MTFYVAYLLSALALVLYCQRLILRPCRRYKDRAMFLVPRITPIPGPGTTVGREYQEAFKIIETNGTPTAHEVAVQSYLDSLKTSPIAVFVKRISTTYPGKNSDPYFTTIQYAVIDGPQSLPL